MLSSPAHHIGGREEFSQEEAAAVGAARHPCSGAEQNFHPLPTVITQIFVYGHLFPLLFYYISLPDATCDFRARLYAWGWFTLEGGI